MTTEPATFDTKAVQLGLPEEPATTTGPHISLRHRQEVLSYLRSRTRRCNLLAAASLRWATARSRFLDRADTVQDAATWRSEITDECSPLRGSVHVALNGGRIRDEHERNETRPSANASLARAPRGRSRAYRSVHRSSSGW